MPDGVATESSISAKDSVKTETPKSPWGFLKNLRGKFKRSPDNPTPNEEPYKAKDPEVPVVKPIVEEGMFYRPSDMQGESYRQRSYLDSQIMRTANKPDLIYTEACEFLDVGAISALPPTRTDDEFKQACHKIETAAYLHRKLTDFANFVRTKSGFSLDDAYDFTTGAFDVRKEGKFDAEAPQKYISSMTTAIREVGSFIDAIKKVQVEGSGQDKRTIYHQKDFHWHNIGVYGPEGYSSTMGRIYLNPKPEFTGKVLQELAVSLIKDSNVSFIMKTLAPSDGTAISAYHLNRPDKIVIYFNSQNEAEMLAMLQDFYNGMSNQQPSVMNYETPPFATRLVGPTHRRKMLGIAFAQSPIKSEESFNGKMKEILYGISSFVTYDPNNQEVVEREFMRRAKEAGFDPYEPAFNTDGQKLFPTIAANSSYV